MTFDASVIAEFRVLPLQSLVKTGWLFAQAALVAVAFATATAAQSYIPEHDDIVLETIPRAFLSGRDELSQLRQRLANDPRDIELASRVAQHYLQMGNKEGDPRFYGYSRAAIQVWWDNANPPTAILKLRAKLKEKEHLYDHALADLRQLLVKEPHDAQAWIELANISRVQGNYAEARKACDALRAFADLVPITLCSAPLQAATGQAQAAYESLAQVMPLAKLGWPTTVPWMLKMQAQIAESLGKEKQAEQHLLAALEQNPNDSYLLRAYGDLLLDQGRDNEALSLLRDCVSDNGSLLRATIAARRTGNHELADEWQSQLARRFEEIRLRGNQPHGRFEARFALELQNDVELALTIALANWEKQKEIRDTRIVLAAAVAANNPTSVAPVLEFLEKHGTEDVKIQNLVQRLEDD